MVIVLDTGVLGLVVHPSKTDEVRDCKKWLKSLLQDGVTVWVPEIADYELRRKLLHIDSHQSIARLEELKSTLSYAPITTAAMQRAAEFWAQARKAGRPTAPEDALDGDAILAAQAVSVSGSAVIATTNVGHLEQFVTARPWKGITVSGR